MTPAVEEFLKQLAELRSEMDAGMSLEMCQLTVAHISMWAAQYENELGGQRLRTFAGFGNQIMEGEIGDAEAKALLDNILPLLREPPVSN